MNFFARLATASASWTTVGAVRALVGAFVAIAVRARAASRSSRRIARPSSGEASSGRSRWSRRSTRSRRARSRSATRSRSSTSRRLPRAARADLPRVSARALAVGFALVLSLAGVVLVVHPSFASARRAERRCGPERGADRRRSRSSAAFLASIAMMMLRRVGPDRDRRGDRLSLLALRGGGARALLALRSPDADAARRRAACSRPGVCAGLRADRDDPRLLARARRARERHGLPRGRRERAARRSRARRAPDARRARRAWRSWSRAASSSRSRATRPRSDGVAPLASAAVIDPSLPYAEQLRRAPTRSRPLCVHAGDEPDAERRARPADRAVERVRVRRAPSTPRARFAAKNDAWIYGRWGNPTVEALEAKLAALEGAEAACATASGMAAIAGALLASCEAGDHVVAPRSMYAESARLLRERLPQARHHDHVRRRRRPRPTPRRSRRDTRVLYVETPSNPTLGVVDIARDRRARAQRDARERPLVDRRQHLRDALRADAARARRRPRRALDDEGHRRSRRRRSAASCSARARSSTARATSIVKGFGGVLSPLVGVARRARAADVRAPPGARVRDGGRARRASRGAPAGRASCIIPRCASHPGHALAQRTDARVRRAALVRARRRRRRRRSTRPHGARRRSRVATHAVSLGDVRTLVVHPASTTHSTMPRGGATARRRSRDGLLRVSVRARVGSRSRSPTSTRHSALSA